MPQDSYEELGKQILAGQKVSEIKLKDRNYKFDYSKEEFFETASKNNWPTRIIELGWFGGLYENGWKLKFPAYKPVQSEFISDFKSHFALDSGAFGSGKSLALYIKLILLCKCFPGNRILLGRKTLSDIDRAVLPDLFELLPTKWYEHRVKDGLINFTNGSQIVLFGLDAMQSGGVADIKKAQQKLKSLNLGGYFIDQLEEVEYEVFEVLNSRLRRNDVPFRQGNMTTNPANFWAYDPFVANPKEGYSLYQTCMLWNPNLPGDYVLKQLGMDEAYVKRFVIGEWSTDSLLKGTVFAKENIQWLEGMRKQPVDNKEGCEIYENPRPGEIYQMGVDPSEGVVDPSSISVVSGSGKKVAKFNGFATIPELADKIKFLYYMYNKPLVIPEVNRSSIIEHIKDLRLYRRRQLDYKDNREIEKVGFSTTHSSKQALITHFQQLLRTKVPKIYDKKTIEEMKTFAYSDQATMQGAGAVRGFHDDDVISTMLAYWEFNPQRVEEVQVAKTRLIPKRKFQYI